MKTSLIVDSTIWIQWLRERIDPRPLLRPWLQQRSCFTCGLIRLEVLRGIISAPQRKRVEELFDLMDDVPMGREFWSEASMLAWELDRAGTVLPSSDIIISTCARRSAACLVTLDRHFKSVPNLKCRESIPSRL